MAAGELEPVLSRGEHLSAQRSLAQLLFNQESEKVKEKHHHATRKEQRRFDKQCLDTTKDARTPKLLAQ